jgi:hypothetical protein
MDAADRIFLDVGKEQRTPVTVMVCLFTGPQFPPFCSPMVRSPSPDVGVCWDESFPAVLASALAFNPSIHDGAVMVGRRAAQMRYSIHGWSFRLYPPESAYAAQPNRGSAFNSCLAMSDVNRVDCVYLQSVDGVFRFERGNIQVLRERRR